MRFQGSRYAHTPVVDAGGARVLGRRAIPAAPGLLEHVVMDGERLDQLAGRFYGDPTRSWRLLDANLGELNPFDLLRPGRRIAVPADRTVDA